MSKQAYSVVKLNRTTKIVNLRWLVMNIHWRAQQLQHVTIEINQCAPQMKLYLSNRKRHPSNNIPDSLKNYSNKNCNIQSRPSKYWTQMRVTQLLRSICHIARPVCLSIYLKKVSGLNLLLRSEGRCTLTYILQSSICLDMKWNPNCVTRWPTQILRRIGAWPKLHPVKKRPLTPTVLKITTSHFRRVLSIQLFTIRTLWCQIWALRSVKISLQSSINKSVSNRVR